LKYLKTFENSKFVDQDEVNDLLDKIYQSGITSISDIEKNRLDLFTESDKKIIDLIERMGDVTLKFKDLNAEMEGDPDIISNKNNHMSKWSILNKQMVKLEIEIKHYGIELGDERLGNLMRIQRPDVYGNDFLAD
tara:strand:- start:54171 stop:54575 length:405 start_codon:yes stop_codon:yes gene_type:complete